MRTPMVDWIVLPTPTEPHEVIDSPSVDKLAKQITCITEL
jgi:hypothetical protein